MELTAAVLACPVCQVETDTTGEAVAMSDAATVISLARTANGYFVRVDGKGTMRESAPLHEFLLEALSRGTRNISIDLSCCPYMDSTFLGGLVDLYKTARRIGNAFVLCRPSEACRTLLDKTRLSTILRIVDECPETIGDMVPVAGAETNLARPEMGRHILNCHRQLAEIESPSQKAFAAVADQLERELATK